MSATSKFYAFINKKLQVQTPYIGTSPLGPTGKHSSEMSCTPTHKRA